MLCFVSRFKGTIMKRFLISILFITLSLCQLSHSVKAENNTTGTKPQQEDVQSKENDSFDIKDITTSDILTEIDTFKNEEEKLKTSIQNYSYINNVSTDFEDLNKQFENTLEDFQQQSKLSNWDLARSISFKKNAQPLFDDLEKINQDYIKFFKQTDKELTKLKKKKDQFKTIFLESSRNSELKSTRKPLLEVYKNVDSYIKDIKKSQNAYAKVFQQHQGLMNQINVFETTLSESINYFKSARYKKNSPALYDNEFFYQFQPYLLEELAISWNHIKNFKLNNFLAFKQFYIQGVLIALFLSIIFLKLKNSKQEKSKIKRPILLACTIALVVQGLRIDSPHSVLIMIYWVTLASCVFLLIRKIPRSKQETKDISFLIFIYTIIQIIDAFGFPLIIYRIFLLILSLLITWYCAMRYRKFKILQKKNLFFSISLQILILLFSVAFIAEITGFHLLGIFLIHGSIQTAFVFFAIWHIKQFLLDIISSSLDYLATLKINIVTKNRDFLYQKFKVFLKILTSVISILFLTTIWGFYDSLSEAIKEIWSLGVTWKKYQLTLGMILQAGLILYFSNFFAFIICLLLEDEVYPRKRIARGTGKSINSLITYIAWVIGGFLAFSALGFELKQFAIIAGALSVGIGFGLQNIVNNFISGLILLFERPIKAGDILEINNELGTVEKVGLRSTIIRSFSKTQLIIPNSDFITQKVTNLTFTDPDYRIVLPFGVAYGSDTNLVKEIVLEVAQKHKDKDPSSEPQVLFTGFGNSELSFELWVWTKNVGDKKRIMSDLFFEINHEFKENGIEIPFPQRDLHLRSVDKSLLKNIKE